MGLVENRVEGGNDVYVKLTSGGFAQTAARLPAWQSRPIRSVRSHSVVCVSDCEHTGNYGDLLSCEPVGISTAVPAFVMMTDNHCDLGIVVDVCEDSFPDS